MLVKKLQYECNVHYSLHLNDPSRHPSTGESCYMTTRGCIYYSLCSSRLKHIPTLPFLTCCHKAYDWKALVWLCLGVTTNVLSTSAKKLLYNFDLYVGKAVSRSNTLWIVFKVATARTMFQVTCQHRQADHNLSKLRDPAICIFSALVLFHHSPS